AKVLARRRVGRPNPRNGSVPGARERLRVMRGSGASCRVGALVFVIAGVVPRGGGRGAPRGGVGAGGARGGRRQGLGRPWTAIAASMLARVGFQRKPAVRKRASAEITPE